MSLNRRTFLKSTAIVGGALGLGGFPSLASGESPAMNADGVDERALVEQPQKKLSILILGGTGFIGPNQVRYALDRGHDVTLFNRGQTNPGLFPTVKKLVGDRNAPDGHNVLKGKKFDVVIDNPTTLPQWVKGAGEALKGNVGHYIFVSTISVFSSYPSPLDENGPLHEPGDMNVAPDQARVGNNYGRLKVRSEMEAKTQFGENVTIVRPGLIVGPGDLTDRFSYWPIRIEKGGEIMAPGSPNDATQYVDARDLSEWIIRLAETKTLGTFNATGPKSPTNMAELLYGIKAVTTSNAKFTWVDADFLQANQVRAWSEMPVWVAPRGGNAFMLQTNCAKAWAAGLTFRPLAVTAKDTLDWYHTRTPEEQTKLAAGIAPEKEKTVLAAWNAKKATGAP